MLYNLHKKGTIIITIGRSGSHLLGDIISNQLKKKNIAYANCLELFLTSVTISSMHNFFKTTIQKVDQLTSYKIIQIQDFQSKLWMIRYGTKWLSEYHVIVLQREDNINHLCSRLILQNFHHAIPVHTIKNIDSGNFNILKNNKIIITVDDVCQFLAEKEVLSRFAADETVEYTDMRQWSAIAESKYLKNNYEVKLSELFTNYTDLVNFLEFKNE
tara:strand:+ start:43 stop:687 length:645 start_codon:yes stop_codon:yes gene_type:complete